MKTPLVYGFAMALANAAFTLLLFFAGLHDTPEKMQTAQWVGMAGGIAIGVVFFALAMREKRENFPADETWHYGHAFGVGVLTALVSAVCGGVFGYLYFAVIHPGMSDVVLEGQMAAMQEKGMTAEQLERAEPMMRKWMSPPVMAIIQVVVGFLWGFLLSLIVAIFYRRRPDAAVIPPLPSA